MTEAITEAPAGAIAMTQAATPARMEAFTFGDPEPISRGSMLDYVEAWFNGRWYDPPIPFDGLADAFRCNPHHSSAIYFKRNVLASLFVPHPKLSWATMNATILDFLVFGNLYLEARKAVLGRTVQMQHSLARWTRRGQDLDSYFFVRGWREEHEFPRGSICHIRQPDINQEIYGLPEYLSALQAAWLNEDATIFRRRYYRNGSHAGFILYISDPAQQQEDIDAIRQALKDAKGPGNFRNLFFYSPNGKPDGVKLIPVSEVAAKDAFTDIKAATRDDVLAAHRCAPQLLGVVPTNTGGFGNLTDAALVHAAHETAPLQRALEQINHWAGEELVRWRKYELPGTKPTA